MHITHFVRIFTVLLLFITQIITLPAYARQFKILRDAETESTIKVIAEPIFKAAGLHAENIHIHIVQDRSINAFVAGGQRIFFNSGLLMRTENVSQLIGVIAHETGHIAGGHLSRVHSARDRSTAVAIMSMIMGAVVSVGTGRPDIGSTIFQGGSHVSNRSLMSFSRSQENSADHAALRYLDATQQSASGLLNFMKLLKNEELLLVSGRDPYALTHPLSQERIKAINEHILKSPYSDKAENPEFALKFARVRAKIIGFVQEPEITLRMFKENDQAVPSRYARAYAYYKSANFKKALEIMKKLSSKYPKDPYFHEFCGQILFESGKITRAIAAYQTAVELAPSEALFRFDLARIQIESEVAEFLDPAIKNLNFALRKEQFVASGWRMLGIAHERKGDKGRSSLAFAESSLLLGQINQALYHVRRAIHIFPKHSPEWLKAQDILIAAEAKKNTKK